MTMPCTEAAAGERNCHLRPNLILLYSKPNDTELELLRLGSHSEIRI